MNAIFFALYLAIADHFVVAPNNYDPYIDCQIIQAEDRGAWDQCIPGTEDK